MKKGIVMEIDDAHLTLMTPDGEFLHAHKRNQAYSIGEEILFSPIELRKRNSHFSFIHLLKIKPLPVAFVALLFLLGSLIPIYQTNKAYAYMSIDVNPSIELGVNKKMQVVKLTAFNQDGKKIISHLSDWKKKEVSQLAQGILKEMNKQGYLKENHEMIISTVRTEKTEKQAEKSFEKNMNEIREIVKENHLKLTVLTGTEKEMEKAHHLGITTGKYEETKIRDLSKNGTKGLKLEQDNVEKNKDNTNSQQNQPEVQLKKNQENNGTAQNQDQKEKQLNISNKNHAPSGQMKKSREKADEYKRKQQDHKGTGEIEKNSRVIMKTKNEWHSDWQKQDERNNEHEKKQDEFHNQDE
jgi:hypothetical protein